MILIIHDLYLVDESMKSNWFLAKTSTDYEILKPKRRCMFYISWHEIYSVLDEVFIHIHFCICIVSDNFFNHQLLFYRSEYLIISYCRHAIWKLWINFFDRFSIYESFIGEILLTIAMMIYFRSVFYSSFLGKWHMSHAL